MPPELGWIKVNTDSLSMGSRGDIFIDSRATFIQSFAMNLGRQDSVTTGILTIIHSINYAIQNDVGRFPL